MNPPEIRARFDELEADAQVAIRTWVEAAVNHLETGSPSEDVVEDLGRRAQSRFNGLVGYAARQLLARHRSPD